MENIENGGATENSVKLNQNNNNKFKKKLTKLFVRKRDPGSRSRVRERRSRKRGLVEWRIYIERWGVNGEFDETDL